MQKNNNMRYYAQSRSTPKNAQKTIGGGRLKGFTDINPQYRIEKLTEMFGPCGIGWTYKIAERWTEKCGDEIAVFVSIDLFVVENGQQSLPIPGTGGSMLYVKEKGDLRLNDEAYKMATTDAISVACKQLGIGADVYWQAGEANNKQSEESVCKDCGKEITGYGKHTAQQIADAAVARFGVELCVNCATARKEQANAANQ